MMRLTRNEAVQAIREKLLTLVDDEHSACEVAARRGIFCKGTAQLSTGELRRRYDWIVRNRLGIRRAELEDIANRWQLARQRVLGVPLACDVQSDGCETHRTCSGWEGFSDPQIAAFYREMLGEEAEILPPTPPEIQAG
ncbi:MAG TPA: hypothetical protein VGR31_16405 [Planctomycetota bacterium]|jgi:hypothetical protein|nr:hypothetical protein [Planctomycetota bacterium]